MTRTQRAAVTVLVVSAVLLLGGCGKGGAPASAETIATWAGRAGIAPELVYVTEIDGFDLATQSVGVLGDDGMSATYMRMDDGSSVLLTTGRGSDASVVPCADLPESAEATMRCSVERGAVRVTLEGQGVDAGVLRAAGEAVRVPSKDALEDLFGDLPEMPEGTIERGDLPSHGDGAPIDEPGVGG